MRRRFAYLAAAAAAVAMPAAGAAFDVTDLATLADALRAARLAVACGFRSETWEEAVTAAVSTASGPMAADAARSIGGYFDGRWHSAVDPGSFALGLRIQAYTEGEMEWHRLGQAACAQLKLAGALPTLDGMAAGAQKPQ